MTEKHPAVPDDEPEWVHRLAFERDQLLEEIASLRRVIEEYQRVTEELTK